MLGKTLTFCTHSGLLGHTYDILYLLVYIFVLIRDFYVSRVSALKPGRKGKKSTLVHKSACIEVVHLSPILQD